MPARPEISKTAGVVFPRMIASRCSYPSRMANGYLTLANDWPVSELSRHARTLVDAISDLSEATHYAGAQLTLSVPKTKSAFVNFPSTLTVLEARLRYFAKNMFGDGGYDRKFTKSKVGPIVIWLPISETRKRALKLHDLHHIATGYDTTIRGEAEVSAWELGSGGIGKYVSAKGYLYLGVFVGLFINPRAVYRAYQRGKGCRNLYHLDFSAGLLALTVGELRRQMGIS